MTFAEKVIDFNRNLVFTGTGLPSNIRVMNPFTEFEDTLRISGEFYRKYYNDNNTRFGILGINPGRFGGGITGVPFTDPKRLVSVCGIEYKGKPAREPSSVFIYDMIGAYGGPEAFYSQFYINSICPLGFTIIDDKGREKNYNYYDDPQLLAASRNFIVDSIHKQLDLGLRRDIGFCFGTGKNENYLRRLNGEYKFFDRIIALEHPRFIVQYKSANKQFYIDKYIQAFRAAIDQC